MSTLAAFETQLLGYLVNALWQVPLVVLAASIAARLLRRSGPAAEHRIWVAALALEALLPAASLLSLPLTTLQRLWHIMLRSLGHPRSGAHTGVTVTLGPGYLSPAFHLPAALLHTLAVLYAITLVFFVTRLARSLWLTLRLGRAATPVAPTGKLGAVWLRCTRLFRVPDAHLALSPDIPGPLTIGIRRRTVLLPAAWSAALRDDDLAAALAHEFAHMRRRDFARNLLYQLLSLPVAFHPALWLTRTRLTETREMLCDELAARALAGPDHYLRSLLRLASAFVHGAPAPTLHAIGIFDANIFERRVMNLTHKRLELRGLRRLAALSTGIVLALGACASALALRLTIASPATPAQPAAAAQATARSVRVGAGVMAGQLLSKINPVYPPEARAAGISGTVVLHAIIGTDGTVEKLAVISGPQELQASALDAVRQWVYKPYLLNGNPTQVETTINVTYSLF